jgi:glycerol dehydrogenase
MNYIFGAPNRYIQGPDLIGRSGEYIRSLKLGDSLLLIVDGIAFSLLKKTLTASLEKEHIPYKVELFGGECSQQEIDRLSLSTQRNKSNCIIGVGGGKTLDTAKAVANRHSVPLVIVPTIASNDSPCSSLSVLYSEEGVLQKANFYHRSPDLVLVDSRVISQAPVRFLISGMGDALATKYEAEACAHSHSPNAFGGRILSGSLHLARLCSETILKYGVKAKLAVENGLLTPDVERIIEANILLSGLGFESGGVAAAHAIESGLTVDPRTHAYYHGERVAFGLLAQFILESCSIKFLNKIMRFYRDVGLPYTLSHIGLADCSKQDLIKIAAKACMEGEPIHNMPSPIDPLSVVDALSMADAFGRTV